MSLVKVMGEAARAAAVENTTATAQTIANLRTFTTKDTKETKDLANSLVSLMFRFPSVLCVLFFLEIQSPPELEPPRLHDDERLEPVRVGRGECCIHRSHRR